MERTQAVISNEAIVTPAGREEGICILFICTVFLLLFVLRHMIEGS